MDTAANAEPKPLMDEKLIDDLDVPSSIDPPPYHDAPVKGETPAPPTGSAGNVHVPMTLLGDIKAIGGFLILLPFCGLMLLCLWALAAIFPIVIVIIFQQLELRGFHLRSKPLWSRLLYQFASAYITILMTRLLFYVAIIRERMQARRANGAASPAPSFKELSRAYSRILFIYSIQYALAAAVMIRLCLKPSKPIVSLDWNPTFFKPQEDIGLREKMAYKEAIVFALSYMVVMFGLGLKARYFTAEKKSETPATTEEAPVVGSEAV